MTPIWRTGPDRGREREHAARPDPYVTVEDRAAFEAEMRAAKIDWRMHLYGGVEHTFTHPHADRAGLPGLRYHERY